MNVIGEGSYGKVTQIKINDKNYAMKEIPLDKLNLTEIDILYNIDCSFLLKGSKVKIDDNIYTDVYNGDLKIFSKKNVIKFDLLKEIIYQVFSGLQCLHKLKFLHLDLRPQNILYKEDKDSYKFVIGDFGFSIKCEDIKQGIKLNCKRGTKFFMPYEILESSYNGGDEYYYSEKSDIWSLGITFLRVININFGKNINYSSHGEIYEWYNKNLRNIEDISLQVNNLEFNIFELEKKNNMKKNLIELLDKMLKKDPNERFSLEELSKLKFFEEFDKNYICLDKIDQLFYIPYSSNIIIEGINKIREYFKTKEKKIRNYFFSVDLWILLCTLKKTDIEEYKKVINYALNYYSNQKLSEEYDLVFKKYIGKNKFYYKSVYLDDLILIDEIVFKNSNLLSLYNFIDIDEIITYFKNNYEYNLSKLKDIKSSEFFKYDLPIRKGPLKDKLQLVNISNIITKNENFIQTVSLNENNLKKELHKILYEPLKKKYELDGINLIYKVENLIKEYDIKKEYYKSINRYRMFTSARKYLNLNFSIIVNKEGILYNEINDKYTLSTYNIFIDDDDSVSFIYKNNNELIHYFSRSIPFLKSKFNGYRANFTYGSKCLCKFMDACIIYLIYSHQKGNLKDFNQIDLTNNTMKLIMLLGFFE